MDPSQAIQALETATRQIADQQVQIANLTTRLSQLEASISNSSPRTPRRKLPDPAKFSGKFYHTWEPLARAVLSIDKEAIGTDEAQFYWFYSVLDERIQALVLPQLKTAQKLKNFTIEPLFERLQRVYGVPPEDQVEDAELAFFDITQGVDSVVRYLARFERLLESSEVTLKDSSKIAILKKGANDTLKRKLNDQRLNLPKSYDKFVESLHRLTKSSGNTGPPPSGPSAPSALKNQPSHAPGQKRVAFNNYTGSTPMDLSRAELEEFEEVEDEGFESRALTLGTGSVIFAPSSTKWQRKRWAVNGLCRRCGGEHSVDLCPYAPASHRPSSVDDDHPWDVNPTPNYQAVWRKELGV